MDVSRGKLSNFVSNLWQVQQKRTPKVFSSSDCDVFFPLADENRKFSSAPFWLGILSSKGFSVSRIPWLIEKIDAWKKEKSIPF